ncbi:MAG: right-handed parallel beta-helix repeat-containing protein, partial [Bacteroidetes bacterium]|nr:right-handed parallel beta-helix repeat-containing protein [Fibrella sp.]
MMICRILCFLLLAGAAFGQPRQPGDAGWLADESRFDPRFPDMKEWAKAGVEGGIPVRSQTPVRQRLAPGQALQPAIDAVAAAGGGVLLLAKGDYPIRQPIILKTGVILRGQSRDSTRLLVLLKANFFRYNNGQSATAFSATDAERIGVENLTIKYAAVAFDPNDRATADAAWSPDVFHRPELRDTSVYVSLLIFTRCR